MMAIIPVAHGQVIKAQVIRGLYMQSITLEIAVVSGNPAPVHRLREGSINKNRHAAQQFYSGRGGFVLLLDSDVVLTDPCVIQLAVEKLKSRPDLIAIIIDTKGGRSPHNCCACCVIRDTDWARINYQSDSMECQCMKIGKLGPVEYLEGCFAYEIAR